MEKKGNLPTTIDEYIAGYPEEIQKHLKEIRQVIKSTIPEARETIKYGIPTFELLGNVVHFGGYKGHIGFYPAPSGIEHFKEEITPYLASKGTLQFPLDKPMPLELVRRITEFRMQENLEKAAAKAKKQSLSPRV
jgi:uncharacterized protein YdhG (YjbR/CyaY superfamily)